MDEVARRCTEVESGARNVDNILTNTLLPDISRRFWDQDGGRRNKPSTISRWCGADGFDYA